MRSIALFLGAGASKAFEFPLTNELLPYIRAGLRNNNLFGTGTKSTAEHARLKRFLRSLYPRFLRCPDGALPSITEVLSLVDHAALTGAGIGNTPLKELASLRRLFDRGIVEALEWFEPFENEPRSLTIFVNWLYDRAFTQGMPLTVLSTNYDIIVEWTLCNKKALTYELIETTIDFGFDWRDTESGRVHRRPTQPSLQLYKLHGALNWLRCPACDHIYINNDGPILHRAFVARPNKYNECHCGYFPLEAVLVAPSSVRDIRDTNLLETWRHSLEALRTADNWFLIGYSLPPEDLAIRSLLMRAYRYRPRPPRVVVVQYGDDPVTKARYQQIFPKCVYATDGLASFIDALPNLKRYVQQHS